MDMLKLLSTQQILCNGGVEYDMDERDVETIQHVENLTPGDTRTDAIGWFKARAQHARKWQVKEASRGERKVILVKVGRVAAYDWSSGFLSHFIFKLNYLIAN
jgi:hypothetical protein